MAMTSCFSPSTLLCSPGQSRAIPRLSSRSQRVLPATCKRCFIAISLRASAADGAQLTQTKEEDKEEEEKALQQLMQSLAISMVLPANYLGQLPNDLRSDLKDAAFALANGPVQRECGELAGEKLLQLSLAWEKGDTQGATSATEELQYVLPSEPSFRDAIGKRLIGAGRGFAATGSYAKGELQTIAKALTVAGEAMQSADATQIREESIMNTRVYKFGDLQVELTAQKCFIGSVFALGFGALSWGLATSVQSIPDSASQYANDNATQLTTSLKGALLLLGYGCTVLSGFALIGLLGLGFQLSANSSTEK